MKNNRKKILLFIFLVLINIILRVYKINSPLADYHSWRQADTAAVARNFIRDKRIDLFHPKYDDLSSIQSGKENPQGWRMVEFPFYQGIIAQLYFFYPNLSIEVYGRLVSIIFNLFTLGVIYYLLLREVNLLTAFFASLTYSVLPYFVFFTRVVLPESTAVGLTFISIFFIYLFSKDKRRRGFIYYFLSIVFLSLGILVKPTVIFYSFPLLFLIGQRNEKNIFFNPLIYLFLILSFIPFIWWRIYIEKFPEGIPANDWLLTKVNTPEGLKTIFFRPAFFRWIFFERLSQLIFGGYLIFFFILGIISVILLERRKEKDKQIFFSSLLLAFFFYLFTFQGGNVQHEYYQVIIFPVLSIFVGLGINFLFKWQKKINHVVILFFFTIVIYLLSFYFSFYKVKNYYQISNELVNIANIIHSLTKENDLLVTDTNGDTTLLYLIDRRGYPAVYQDLSYFKNIGVKYFYTTQNWVIDDLINNKKYQPVFLNQQFALFSL